MKKLLILISTTLLFSCTQNQRAKQFGGTATINLPKGQKLLTLTWKEDEIWYLTRPMTKNDSAGTYQFQEESSFGILEGTVILQETK